MKKIKLLTMLAALTLAGYGVSALEIITVAATQYPNGEILEDVVKPQLAKKGYVLKIHSFSSYNDQRISLFSRKTHRAYHLNRQNPNFEVLDGEADANFFQHSAYLEHFNDDYGDELQRVEGVFYVPYAMYAAAGESAVLSAKGLANLHNGASVYIPDGAINQERALRFLEQLKLIKLNKGAGYLKVSDIRSNPRQLDIVPVDEVTLPTMLQEQKADFVVMNSGQAATKGVPLSHTIASEVNDPEYQNILVARKGNMDTPKIKALAEALHSSEVKEYIRKHYHGEVIPVF